MTEHTTPKRSKSELVSTSVNPSHRTSATAFTAAPPDADDPLLEFAPYLHPHPRRNSITPAKQRTFIATLAATGIVTQAARSIGVSLEALYKLRRLAGAEGFAAAWEAALDHGVARLEDCALALAVEGEELPIVSAGQMLGTYRKHNFAHIRFMLSNRRAERYAAGSGSYAALVPGHPVYERLRAAWEAEQLAARRANDPQERREIARKMLVLQARQREYFKRELRIRGAESILAEPDVERQVAALGPGELPPNYNGFAQTGVWETPRN